MLELEQWKKELKQLNQQYAKIRELPPEERGDFGRKLNDQKQQILGRQ